MQVNPMSIRAFGSLLGGMGFFCAGWMSLSILPAEVGSVGEEVLLLMPGECWWRLKVRRVTW